MGMSVSVDEVYEITLRNIRTPKNVKDWRGAQRSGISVGAPLRGRPPTEIPDGTPGKPGPV